MTDAEISEDKDRVIRIVRGFVSNANEGVESNHAMIGIGYDESGAVVVSEHNVGWTEDGLDRFLEPGLLEDAERVRVVTTREDQALDAEYTDPSEYTVEEIESENSEWTRIEHWGVPVSDEAIRDLTEEEIRPELHIGDSPGLSATIVIREDAPPL